MLEDAGRRWSSTQEPSGADAAAGDRRAAWSAWTRRARWSARRTTSPAGGVDPDNLGLRDLHLGLDRPAQGGGGRAPRRRSTCSPGCRTPTGSEADDRRAAADARSASTSRSASSSGRWPAARGWSWRRPSAAPDAAGAGADRRRLRHHARPLRAVDAAGSSWRRSDLAAVPRPCGTVHLRRRGAAAAAGGARPAQPHGGELHNLYGPTEAAVDVDASTLLRRASGDGARADRPADRQHAALRARTAHGEPVPGRRRRASCTSAAPAWRAATWAARS